MIIRIATIEDLDQLGRMFDLYRKFYNQASNIAAAKVFLRERIERKDSVVFVAVQDGILVGFTQLYPIFSSVGLKKAWLLNDLYVEENSRKQGVAAALLDMARKHGIQTQAGWLMLQTGPDNFKAQGLYQKQGWVRENDFFYRLDI